MAEEAARGCCSVDALAVHRRWRHRLLWPSRPAISLWGMVTSRKMAARDAHHEHVAAGMITGNKRLGDEDEETHLPPHQTDAQGGGQDGPPDGPAFEWIDDGTEMVTWVARWWVWHGCFLCTAGARVYLAGVREQLGSSTDSGTDAVFRILLWSVAVAVCEIVCMISGLAVLILNLRTLILACIGVALTLLAMVGACGTAMVPVIAVQAGPRCSTWQVVCPAPAPQPLIAHAHKTLLDIHRVVTRPPLPIPRPARSELLSRWPFSCWRSSRG